jgi:peptidylprolyl isomerase
MRLISIKKEGLPADLVKKKVESVQAALASGKAFELVAQEFSDFAPDKGGDLGTVKKQDLRPDYLKAIEGLKPNQNAGPIDSEGEIAFLRLLQILPATGKSLEEVQPELERELRRASEEELYQSWVKRLRLKYPVVIYTPRE